MPAHFLSSYLSFTTTAELYEKAIMYFNYAVNGGKYAPTSSTTQQEKKAGG